MPIGLLVATLVVVVFYYLFKPRNAVKPHTQKWLKRGGLLGGLIMLSRLTRTPLATLLAALPFLIEALQRVEAQQRNSAPPTTTQMTRDEALLILGLSKDATPDEIKAAHRKLMQKMHPDAGGNDYLAAKINQARDSLLG